MPCLDTSAHPWYFHFPGILHTQLPESHVRRGTDPLGRTCGAAAHLGLVASPPLSPRSGIQEHFLLAALPGTALPSGAGGCWGRCAAVAVMGRSCGSPESRELPGEHELGCREPCSSLSPRHRSCCAHDSHLASAGLLSLEVHPCLAQQSQLSKGCCSQHVPWDTTRDAP